MRVSIVTISYNQGRFLEQALRSVIDQDYKDLEYIVVDPGSSDGSREIIRAYQHRLDEVIIEPDEGPADGLNKGFAHSTGEILGMLNSDDVLLPGAVRTVAECFQREPVLDVLSGHALVLDEGGDVLRKTYSDLFSLTRFAYGVCVLIQPSTFFRRSVFERVGGFNPENRVNWDAELFVDMGLLGARFARIEAFLSGFRIHGQSITGTRKFEAQAQAHNALLFQKVMGRQRRRSDGFMELWMKIFRYFSNPRDVSERIRHGRIYGRASERGMHDHQ